MCVGAAAGAAMDGTQALWMEDTLYSQTSFYLLF